MSYGGIIGQEKSSDTPVSSAPITGAYLLGTVVLSDVSLPVEARTIDNLVVSLVPDPDLGPEGGANPVIFAEICAMDEANTVSYNGMTYKQQNRTDNAIDDMQVIPGTCSLPLATNQRGPTLGAYVNIDENNHPYIYLKSYATSSAVVTSSKLDHVIIRIWQQFFYDWG